MLGGETSGIYLSTCISIKKCIRFGKYLRYFLKKELKMLKYLWQRVQIISSEIIQKLRFVAMQKKHSRIYITFITFQKGFNLELDELPST